MSVFNFIGKTAFNYNSVSCVIFKNSDGRANLHISKIVKDIFLKLDKFWRQPCPMYHEKCQL